MRNFNGAARTARRLLLEFAVFLSAGLSGTSFAQYPDKPVDLAQVESTTSSLVSLLST